MTVRLAQVGYGYWGRNLLRAFAKAPGGQLVAACDAAGDAVAALRRDHPGVEVAESFASLLARRDVDAVIVATPAGEHFAQARAALAAGKHVFVEKPLATSVAEARELVTLAARASRTLMVGHTFLYNDAVRWVKDYIDRGELGELYYANFQRLNLGRVRRDVDALWNLAPHDVSIALHWFGESPADVRAQGVSFLQPGIDDVSFLTLRFPSGRFAHIHVSWLDPSKTRRAVVVGSRKMVQYDDTSADMRIMVFDKGIDRRRLDTELGGFETFDQFQLVQRAGDVWVPHVRFREPLQVEAAEFLESIAQGRPPLTGGPSGLAVVETLERATLSRRAAP